MEIEKEPQRKTTPHLRPRNKPPIFTEPQTAKFERVSYAREAGYIMAALFITLGLVGFVVDNLLGAHLSYAHNLIHVTSGIIALACAYHSRTAAQRFAVIFGSLYGAFGVLGFALGTSSVATLGPRGRDASLWVLSPEVLELGTVDHFLHLAFAVFLIGAAVIHRQRRKEAAPIYH